MSDEVVQVEGPPKKPSLKQRLKDHFAEYGSIAIYTYLTLSVLTIAAFSIAFGFGLAPTSASGVGGVIFAGWIAAKATMPLRILATLGITPLIATFLNRRKLRRQGTDEQDGDVPPSDT